MYHPEIKHIQDVSNRENDGYFINGVRTEYNEVYLIKKAEREAGIERDQYLKAVTHLDQQPKRTRQQKIEILKGLSKKEATNPLIGAKITMIGRNEEGEFFINDNKVDHAEVEALMMEEEEMKLYRTCTYLMTITTVKS
jgi:hypothetical protein